VSGANCALRADVLDLAFAKGLISGRHYGLALLRPANTANRPRCPYWCPLRWLTWRIAFAIGVHDMIDYR
jgi:hypothetical protein